jgi:hypothetical protein
MSDRYRARNARNTPLMSDRTTAAWMFSASTPRRRLKLKRPVWIEVESRLPIAPKIAPRIPMAAGIRTARPTSSSSLPEMLASAMPATSSPVEEMNSDANPCLRDSFSSVRYPKTRGRILGRTRSRRRAPPANSPSLPRRLLETSNRGRRSRSLVRSLPSLSTTVVV